MKPEIKIHQHENNADSKRHLKENEEKFSNQCKKVLSLLRQGVVLTSRSAMIEHDIGDVHRRIGELRESGVEGIVDEWVLDDEVKKTRFKKWFMSGVEVKAPQPKKQKIKTITRNKFPENQQPLFQV